MKRLTPIHLKSVFEIAIFDLVKNRVSSDPIDEMGRGSGHASRRVEGQVVCGLRARLV